MAGLNFEQCGKMSMLVWLPFPSDSLALLLVVACAGPGWTVTS